MELDSMAPVGGSESEAPPPQAVPINDLTAPQKFVTFYIGERQYALHSSAVSEVTARLKPTSLPDAPDRLVGIAPLRGEIVAVVDLGGPAQSSAASDDKQKTVVLKNFDADVEMPIAFNIDRLGEFISIDLGGINAVADESDPLANLEAATPDGPIRVIEPSSLTSALHR